MKKLSLTLATIALLGAYSANAAEYPTNQFYVGADFGGATVEPSDALEGLIAENHLFGQINGGIQLHPNLAIELGYFRTNEESESATATRLNLTDEDLQLAVEQNIITQEQSDIIAANGGNIDENFKSEATKQGIYLDAVANYEFVENARVLGSVGIAYVETTYDATSSYTAGIVQDDTLSDLKDEEYAAKFGLGLSYDLTENIAARTLVNYYATDDAFVTYTAGLQYRF